MSIVSLLIAMPRSVKEVTSRKVQLVVLQTARAIWLTWRTPTACSIHIFHSPRQLAVMFDTRKREWASERNRIESAESTKSRQRANAAKSGNRTDHLTRCTVCTTTTSETLPPQRDQCYCEAYANTRHDQSRADQTPIVLSRST